MLIGRYEIESTISITKRLYPHRSDGSHCDYDNYDFSGCIEYRWRQKKQCGRELFYSIYRKLIKNRLDQSRVLALETHGETDVSPFSYELYEYHDQSTLQVQDIKTVGRNILSLKHGNFLPMFLFSTTLG